MFHRRKGSLIASIIIGALFSLLMFSAALGFGSDFSRGFKDGFKAGYCYQEYSCIAPVAPVAPVPQYGRDSYQDGYNEGFVAGMDAKESGF